MKRFSISPILYEEVRLMDFGFLIKENFCYVISIWNFTGLNVCIKIP